MCNCEYCKRGNKIENGVCEGCGAPLNVEKTKIEPNTIATTLVPFLFQTNRIDDYERSRNERNPQSEIC